MSGNLLDDVFLGLFLLGVLVAILYGLFGRDDE